MVIKNKIWEEMKQAHANVLCVKWYTDKQRKHERYYQMFIALVASGGTFGYLLNEIAPLISSSIIAFVSLVKDSPLSQITLHHDSHHNQRHIFL